MNQKKLKKIRRFGKLRFSGNPQYQERVLISIYEKADDEKRELLDAEMDQYFEAIENSKIKEGDSILKSVLADNIKPAKG